ncbi:MmcQ/YjbR family DNA-binding protein [Candidatus Saccharibacteria bacterium]|nr:MmcQ/YjbR family DNA-binding protein [Candidatus Saccharibacteria bacterium]
MSEKRQANIVVEHIKSEYGANPEFLWPDRYPGYTVFRHDDNKKWFALVATISSKSLGLEEDKATDVINLKFDKNQTYDFAETSDHIFPAYHMNKNNWITIWLDGTLADEVVFELVRKSYLMTDG